MTEKDIDILEDFTYNETLPLQFLLATYNNNLDREEDEVVRLKENIIKRDIKVLKWIAGWTIDAQENYIEHNIDNVNKEILLGYRMSTLPMFKNIREKIITFTTKLSKKKKETNDNEYYELALESFKNKDFEDALEYLKDYEVSSSKKEVLKSNIYKEIGQPFNEVKNELLSIREVFVKEGRTDIKKYIKELKLEDYPNLKFIVFKLTTQAINSLTFSLTYIENVNDNKDLYIKTIDEFHKIVENSLINVSEEQNKVLENNVLAWRDLKTGLVWEVNKKKSNFKYKSAKDILKKLNSQEYAGFKDWRLPTIDELKTLISDNLFNESYIKKPLYNEMNSLYWTSTSNLNDISMMNFKTKREENVKVGYHASFISVRGKL
jgi:hypothetical protein